MATIKPFLFTGEAPVAQPLPTVDPQKASAVQTATAVGYSELSEMFASNARMFAGAASSAMSNYQQNSLQNKLAQVRFEEYVKNPEIIASMAKGADNETLLKLKMAEAQKLEQLPTSEMNYLDVTSIKMQEDYLKADQEAKKQTGPDGSGYMDYINNFFNDATVGWMKQAPSETSATEMMSKIQELKLRALSHGMDYEQTQRQKYAVVQANEAGDSLIRQAIQAPENLSAYLAQGDQLKEMLVDNGLTEPEAQKWLSAQRDKIVSGYMGRRILDNPTEALAELTQTDIMDYMAPESLITTITRAADGAREQAKQAQKEVVTLEAISRVKSGLPLREGVSEDENVANTYYDQITSQIRDPQTGVLSANSATPEVIFRALKDTPNILPAKAKVDIVNSITYGTPDVAAGMSHVLRRMTADPELGRIAAKFDSKELQMGVMISDAVSAGASPEEAVADARKRFLVSAGSMEQQRNKEADAYLTTSAVQENLTGLFSSWLAPIAGVNEWFLGHGYSGEGGKFHDPNNLGAAYNEYSRFYRRAYLDSGDASAADAYAKTQLQRTWSSTTVNGSPELMQYSPDIVFPGRGHDFKEKLTEAAAQLKVQHPDLGDIVVDSKDYFGTNQAQYAQRFPVYHIDSNGIKRPVIGPNGLQMSFDYTSGLTPDEKTALEEARARQASINSGLEAQRRRADKFKQDLMKSKSVQSMNGAQRLMVKAALWAVDR